MSTKHLERLLLECKEALIELDATMKPRHSKAHQTYLSVKGQLEHKCSGCGDLMNIDNCCITNIEEMKTYHVGCQPKTPQKLVKKEYSDSEKIDAILSMMWNFMKGKTRD